MSTLLPFLYPRMACRALRSPAARQCVRRCYSQTPSPSSSLSPSPAARARPPARRSADPIPFELPPDMAEELLAENAAREAAAADDGTITPLEKRAFRRIFKEISARQDAEAPATATATAATTRARVNTIVAQATQDVAAARLSGEVPKQRAGFGERKKTDASLAKQRQAVLAQFPPSLRAAAGAAMGIREQEKRRTPSISTDGAAAEDGAGERAPLALSPAQKERAIRQKKMEVMMMAQKTDTALWDYMEEHVYGLVDEFGLAGPVGPVTAQKRPTPATTSDSTTTTTTPRPPSEALAVYGPLYPALLLQGLRLLTSRFHGGRASPLAEAVLPRAKARGLASYVLGASTPLYDELLRLRWTRRGDAVGVFRLLAEMQRAELPFSHATRAVLRSMEYHLVPLQAAMATTNKPHAFVGAALRHLPGLVEPAPGALAYWIRQVDNRLSRR